LRQQVLESRGWTVHRIWSLDWFQRPDAELRRALAAIENAKLGHFPTATAFEHDDVEPADDSSEEAPIALLAGVARASTRSTERPSILYVEASFPVEAVGEIHAQPAAALARSVAEIVKVEGPIHEAEVFRRAASLWGQRRTGNRIVSALQRGVLEAERRRWIVRDDDFLQSPQQAESVTVRDRSFVLAPGLKKPECLPPAEIREALRQAVRDGFGMVRNEAIAEAARALGFKSLRGKLKPVLELQLDRLVAAGELLDREGVMRLPDTTTGSPAVLKIATF
jgi:hypothetical protein